MFSGEAMKAAPGFSVCATLKALRTISAVMPGSSTCVLYLVIGWNMFTRSRIWWLSLCRRVVAPCPAIATIGARSMLASATPVMRLVAPGPRVDMQKPPPPVRHAQTPPPHLAALVLDAPDQQLGSGVGLGMGGLVVRHGGPTPRETP